MADFAITVDMTSDMSDEFYEQQKINRIRMPFIMDGIEYGTKEREMTPAVFYERVRQGAKVSTCQVDRFHAKEVVEEHLKAGQDVIHFSFSSNMSGSCESMKSLSEELLKVYPDRKIYIVDSLSGSGGEGLLCYYAVKLRDEGKSFDEVREWLAANILNSHVYFVVDDLVCLSRGGRISKLEGIIGSILKIKPVLYLSSEGKIAAVAKAIGMKKAVSAMISLMKDTYIESENEFVMIGHCGNLELAEQIGEKIKEVYKVQKIHYEYVSPLIGGHCGYGAVGVFFMGAKRPR